MRLGEALQIIGQATGGKKVGVHLLCGFEPLYLATFMRARLALRFADAKIELLTGLFGDLEGNIDRARGHSSAGAIVAIEWSDLDQRLGLRTSAGWSLATLDDIAVQVEEKCGRLQKALAALGAALPVAVLPPALGLPPLTHIPPRLTGAFELRLRAALIGLLQRLCDRDGIRIANESGLPTERHDVRMDLHAGFPYTLAYADAVAELAVDCLFPKAPKKGLITDLDQTLWRGILGDAGVDGVSWSLEGKSQAHALYQQTLASLADSGVLVAIASKNDPNPVEAALQRPDMLLSAAQVFPVEVGWGAKSAAVDRILKAWNVGADSVVFVDDSPMELAEVAEEHPGIECLLFPPDDPAAVVALLWQLRARFGKSEIREEDRLRLNSLRSVAAIPEAADVEASADFLARLDAKMTFAGGSADARAFELVNKTNQFNLNGVRYTEAAWKALMRRPSRFVATVTYEDRFGPLGKIAVLGGSVQPDFVCVDLWVMSCRAFSRQIEFQCLRQMFAKTGKQEIRFRFAATERNGPLQTFFAHLLSAPTGEDELRLRFDDFVRLCPTLHHQVNDEWTLSEIN